ncbi:MAG: porin family protein [Clostridium sp.]|nr:porin family protein [Clostridium sp.]
MKKLVIALFAAMLFVSAQAQLRTSRTFFKSNSRTEWILRAGASFNNIAGLDGDGLESKLGFDVDFGFNKYFGASNLYWGMELGVGTRGTGVKDGDGFTGYNVKYSPFTIGYKFPITGAIKIDPHFGGYASYDFTHTNDVELENDFDAGIQAGVGLWYGRINLDFMYQRGFVDMLDGGGKTSNFLIRVGYAF